MKYEISDADMATMKDLYCRLFNIGCSVAPTGPTGPTPGTSRPGLLYGYYAGGVVPEFADHCNILFIGGWGDWITPAGRAVITQNFIKQTKAAVANGITRVMIALDWCMYNPQFHPLPTVQAQANLNAFIAEMLNAGLLKYVAAIYPIDEPDVNGVSGLDVLAVNQSIRNVCAWYPDLKGKPLAVTYGVNGTPGIGSYDWAGFDNYGTDIFNNGEYNNFVSKLTSTQKVILVPGGSVPWKDDPAPFNNKAQTDPRVVMIMPFMWFDNGTPGAGIVSNGMAPQYRAVGKPIKAANPG